jgi:group II intron reverse transcriptase/maturase
MKILERLEVISKISEKNENWIHKELFRMLHQEEIWILAYQNTKGNKGNLTPGIDGFTYDGLNLDALRRLRDEVVSERYQFKPVKQVLIPKPDGRLRPLGIPTASDKIVQEVMRIILEAVYEPIFDKNSYGFRPNRGTHQALQYVEQTFRWVDWVIEGDIQAAYPTIDHQILFRCIKKRIGDDRFLRLIQKSLKAGVMVGERISRSVIGVPQGSIVSPLFANIYYHEFDLWIRKKAISLDKPVLKLKSEEYKKLEHEIAKLSKELKVLTKNSQEYKTKVKELKSKRASRLLVPSLKQKSTEIRYVRYVDDWVIGIKGDYQIAAQLKDEVREFLNTELKQEMHPEKTKITNLRGGKVAFLGYEIYLPKRKGISVYISNGTRTVRRTNPMLRFDVPVDKLMIKLIERGYVTRNKKGIRPISKNSYVSLEDHAIIEHFRSVWVGLANYYSGCTSLKRLQYIHYLLKFSCAMTLGHKHRMNIRKVFAKYQEELTAKVGNTGKTVCFPNRTNWSVKERKWLIKLKFKDPFTIFANRISRSNLECACHICGMTEKVEMHHVKHVRKGGNRYAGFTAEMSLLSRKQIPLCKACHIKVHEGNYDGPTLKSWQTLPLK